ncbi:37129_t:CDS:2, partial [Racocetra persica]
QEFPEDFLRTGISFIAHKDACHSYTIANHKDQQQSLHIALVVVN